MQERIVEPELGGNHARFSGPIGDSANLNFRGGGFALTQQPQQVEQPGVALGVGSKTNGEKWN
jgi:hypothetical protein